MGSKMDDILTPGRRELLTKSMEGAVREPIKGAVKEAMAEAEAERSRTSKSGRVPGRLMLLGIGATIGYLLRGRGMDVLGPFGPTPTREADRAEKPESRPEPTEKREEPAEESADETGRGLITSLLVVGAVVAVGYLLRSRTDVFDTLASGVAKKTGMAAEETEAMADEAAERVAVGGETVADRIETGGEEMAEAVEEGGEEMAEEFEEAGERAEEMEEEMEERAEDVQEAVDGEEDEEE